MKRLLQLALLSALAACSTPAPRVPEVRPLETPAAGNSGEANLTQGADGELYLSWVEIHDETGHRLRYSQWNATRWSAPITVASGSGWFVNWADFPSLAVHRDGTVLAHWLARSGEPTYAYDIRLSLSGDGGNSWSPSFTPHDDGTPTEHGFVSMLPVRDGFDVVWLDGRDTAGAHDASAGPMTLRWARVDREGQPLAAALLDNRVCDCCQTAAVRAADGALVVAYRDRTPEEIRDISVIRIDDDGIGQPVTVAEDNWRMPACPVNGPALAAAGDRIACAWFTMEGQQGQVLLARSDDAGRSFGPPLRIDQGRPIGRVDLVLQDDGTAVVSWVEGSQIRARRVPATGPAEDYLILSGTDESRASGFPRIAQAGEDLIVAWTDPASPATVRTALVPALLRP